MGTDVRVALTLLVMVVALLASQGRPPMLAYYVESAGPCACLPATPVAPGEPGTGAPGLGRVPAPLLPVEGERPGPARAQGAVEWARQDLAERLNVALDTIKLVSVEAVQWPDSSLGCPTPGAMYLQVITPGYRILLQSGDRQYDYRSANGQSRARLCRQSRVGDEGSRPVPPEVTLDDPTR